MRKPARNKSGLFRLPKGLRYSTLRERDDFYRREFDLRRVKKWFSHRANPEKSTVFALIIGRHTRIYPKKYENMRKDTVLIDDYKNIQEVKEFILQYLPEAAYYDRNVYKDISACASCEYGHKTCWKCPYGNFLGQELAFDVDPENIPCPYHGTLGEKLRRKQGLGFCMYEFFAARKQAVRLYGELSRGFENLRVVYSGRGFHIHVLDEGATAMTKKERAALAKDIKERYAIDEWVTSGESRLIRLPYSLHGMVSRVCTPLAVKDVAGFDPRTAMACFPAFLNRGPRGARPQED